MPDYDKKLHRLLAILNKLETARCVTVRDLSEEFNVGVRTVQRDMMRLLAAGFPVTPSENRGEYCFEEGFSLRKLDISDEEATLLALMSDSVVALGSNFEQSFKSLFRKITTPVSQDSPYHVIITPAAHNKSDYAFCSDLETAIETKHKIVVEFSKAEGKNTINYTGCPLKMIFWEGFWYLMLIVDGKGENIWKFRFDKIKSVTMLRETFKRPSNIDEILADSTNVWFGGARNIVAKLRVHPEVAGTFRLKQVFSQQKVLSTESDGSLIIEARLCSNMEAIPQILYWLPQVTVIEPQSLKAELRSMIEAYLPQIS